MLCSFIKQTATSRFVNVSDEDISLFLEKNENRDTARKHVLCNNLQCMCLKRPTSLGEKNHFLTSITRFE